MNNSIRMCFEKSPEHLKKKKTSLLLNGKDVLVEHMRIELTTS